MVNRGMTALLRRVLSRRISVEALIELGLWLALPYLLIGIVYTFLNAARVDWMEAQLNQVLPAGANIVAFAESTLLWPLLLLTPLICP